MAKIKSSNSKIKRGGVWRLILRILKLTLIWFVGLSVLWVIIYRFVDPPGTWLMVQRGFERKSAGKEWKVDKKWINFDDIADPMKRAAVAAEDATFMENHGFDFKAIERAIDNNTKKNSHKLEGGSTITQQTAKNVFLWPGRNIIRKGFEAWFTLLIDIFWSKQRVMEVYLNEIEMGDGIYGVEAASQAYFHVSASQLNKTQAALIAACWPNPLKWTPNNPDDHIVHKKYLIIKNMRRLGPLDF